MYKSITYIETCGATTAAAAAATTTTNKQTNNNKKSNMTIENPKQLPQNSILGRLLIIYLFIIVHIPVPVEYSAQYR